MSAIVPFQPSHQGAVLQEVFWNFTGMSSEFDVSPLDNPADSSNSTADSGKARENRNAEQTGQGDRGSAAGEARVPAGSGR